MKYKDNSFVLSKESNSPSLICDLQQYDLLFKAGKERYLVTKTAKDILDNRAAKPQEFRVALYAAFISPSILRYLQALGANKVEKLVALQFNKEEARKLVELYQENIEFLESQKLILPKFSNKPHQIPLAQSYS